MSAMPETLPAPRPVNRILRTALAAGVESAVRVHIARGDDLEWRDERGFTPLMIAASRNRASICRMLIEAGVEMGAMDNFGRDARAIAQAFGAKEALEVIESSAAERKPTIEELPAPAPQPAPPRSIPEEPPQSEELAAATDPRGETRVGVDAPEEFVLPANEAADETSAPEQQPDSARERARFDVVDLGDEIDLDALSQWEPESESAPPPDDPSLSADASTAQAAISDHEPIDTSADWDDIDAFLPARAAALPRADDAEAREKLRLVLLRAVREGSVPLAAIEDLSVVDGQPPDDETVALLRMVVNDLGAEADERFEYGSSHESYEVFVEPAETPDEEDEVTGALAALDGLAEPLNEPFRFYQREFQRVPLLTAAAEVSIAQAMERGVEEALDALASWPAGVEIVVASARAVISGAKELRWMSSSPPRNEPQQFDADAEGDGDAAPDAATLSPLAMEAGSEDDEGEQPPAVEAEAFDEAAEFLSNIERLSELPLAVDRNATEWRARRDTLASLRLARSFLLGLADAASEDHSQAAIDFAEAAEQYRRARDRMATANLKLVISIAKKYLFCSLPFDDLIQEGNLGLMKAVDRYDWRRGYKFSTYATWWIRQQVGRSVAEKNRLIRVPVHLYEKMQKIAQTTRVFESSRGRTPTAEEIAAIVGMPVHKVEALAVTAQEPVSIDDLDDLDDLIAPHAKDGFSVDDPTRVAEDWQLRASVDRFLGTLKVKQERILRMRFGIGVQDSLTLEEIGERLDVTRERIRQIEAKAIRLLKHPARLDVLLHELGEPMSKRRPRPDAPTDDEPGDDDGLAAAAPPATPAVRAEPDRTDRPSSIDRLLDQARALGVPVQDERASSGSVWVELFDNHDAASRKLIRKFRALGFELWPGKGYWK